MCALAHKDQSPWSSKYAGVFVMQISSQMVDATMLRWNCCLSQYDPGPRGDMAEAPLSYSPVFSVRGRPVPGISSHVPE